MKITAIGSSRKVYAHAILDCELKKFGEWHELTWYVDKNTGNITFFWGNSLRMNGNYQFSAELSRKEIVRLVSTELPREEIIRLFVSSMSDVSFGEVVRLFTENGKKPTTAGRSARRATPAARSKPPSPAPA